MLQLGGLRMLKKSNDVLERLFEVIESRKGTSAEISYTAYLLDAGTTEITKKVGEEAVETIIAALSAPERIASESADLLYHLLVLWSAAGIKPLDVWSELEKREGVGGFVEKASRV